MIQVVLSVMLVIGALAVVFALLWGAATKRGAARAQRQCQQQLAAEREAMNQEMQALRESVSREIQALNQECDRVRQENARLRMPTMEMAKHWTNVG